MRAIMYHYVRRYDPELPYFLYLDADDFARQVRHFAESGGLLSRPELEEALASGTPPAGKFLLTFDDGLVDHYVEVLPVLEAFGAAGVFYVSTGPYSSGAPLAVHIAHVLLGRVPAPKLLSTLAALLSPDMLVSGEEGMIALKTYRRQNNAPEAMLFKRLVNYQIKYSVLNELLEAVSDPLFPQAHELARRLYLSSEQIDDMVAHGMVVGAHAVSHRSLARLPELEWRREIDESLDVIERLTMRQCPLTFCYPFGGAHNYPREAPAYAAARGCAFSFDVDPRDITADILREHRQVLPRYDCNHFPHGGVSGGWKAT